LLDSALPDSPLGRFSFVGADPYLLLRVRGAQARLDARRDVRPDLPRGTRTWTGDPLDLVRSLMPPEPSITHGAARCPVPFVGGAVGYWGYELGEHTQPIELTARDDLSESGLGLPDLALFFVDRLVAVDHREARAWVLGLGFGGDEKDASDRACDACFELEGRVARVPAVSLVRPRSALLPQAPGRLLAPRVPAPAGLSSFFDEASYGEAVREVVGQIERGNVYQANLTHRMELPLPGIDPLDLYVELRDLNPAPFAAYLELPEAAILSSSPERFLQLDPAGQVGSRPIKGTRPRGRTGAEDRRLEQELRDSEKDRAENLMIVDLVRNDLGRVCRVGSIEVPELMAVEPYATVHQMVSTVTGQLLEECDAMDLVRASFPPGSMTGAPKLAAMQLIDRLEPVRRGVYSGGLGYLDVRGGLDLSVVIRTLIVTGERALLHVGGGIVADSNPVAEWQETLDKARALLVALSRVTGRSCRPRAASSSGR
jgi:para-aminobenzoate synthetase component 1